MHYQKVILNKVGCAQQKEKSKIHFLRKSGKQIRDMDYIESVFGLNFNKVVIFEA